MKIKSICLECGNIYYKRLRNTRLCQDCRIRLWREKNKALNPIYLNKLPCDDDIAILLRQYTDKEIAERYGVSKQAVNHKRNRLKIKSEIK